MTDRSERARQLATDSTVMRLSRQFIEHVLAEVYMTEIRPLEAMLEASQIQDAARIVSPPVDADAERLREEIHNAIVGEIYERSGYVVGYDDAVDRIMSLPAIARAVSPPVDAEMEKWRDAAGALAVEFERLTREKAAAEAARDEAVRALERVAEAINTPTDPRAAIANICREAVAAIRTILAQEGGE